MAALAELLPTIEEILAGGGGVAGLGIRTGLGALLGFAVGDLLNFLKGNPQHKNKFHFAIVDLKNDGKIVTFLSSRRTYRILTRPRGRSRTRKVVVVNAQTGQRVA